MENNSLSHWGIKGMKWGRRRYQNSDGSLTPAGKKRYDSNTNGIVGNKPKPHVFGRVPDKNPKGPTPIFPTGRIPDKNPKGPKPIFPTGRVLNVKNTTENMSDDARAASSLKKKSVKSMSNAELRKLNERVRLEQEYSRLNPSVIKKGLAIAGGVAAGLGTVVALHNNGKQAIDIGKKVVAALAKKP